MPSARIFLVRHAETEWSLSGQHTSRTDLSLTSDGRRRTEGIRRVLTEEVFASVYTSPLRRARETCALAGLDDRAEVRPELAEWDYGEYEGRTTKEIRETVPGWAVWTDGAPGGESPEQVGERVDGFIAAVREESEGTVAVFSHGHLSRVLAARWIGLPVAVGQSLLLGTGAISVLGVDRGTPVIERWNDESHMRPPPGER
jgi:broad specificity phosphatase PhoE